MKNTKAVACLATLISVNNKRYDRYHRAADQMKDINRKLIFMNYAVQSQEFIHNLNKWIAAYSFGSTSFDTTSNVLAKTIISIKNILALGSRKFLLSHCEFVEREALKTYKMVLNESMLSEATIADIKKQALELEGAYLTIKSLRHAPIEHLQVA